MTNIKFSERNHHHHLNILRFHTLYRNFLDRYINEKDSDIGNANKNNIFINKQDQIIQTRDVKLNIAL